MTNISPNTRPNRNEWLIQLSRLLNKTTDLFPFLQQLVDCAAQLTLSQSCSIALVEEETGYLKYLTTSTSQTKFLERTRIPVNESITGEAFLKNKPISTRLNGGNNHVFQHADSVDDFIVHSIAAVPLVYQGKPIGALEAINKYNLANYTEEDIKILETVGGYAATAIFTNLLMEEMLSVQQSLDEFEKHKSDFVAITSHELRTPLGLILGHASMLAEDIHGGDEKIHLEAILRNVDHIKNLIDNMLQLDTIPKNPNRIMHAMFAVDQVVIQVARDYEGLAKKKQIEINTRICANNLNIYGDAEKISLAIRNLVDNAVAFTGENGHILLCVDRLPGFAKISVIDDGVGIPAKDQDKVFERFYQVESHFTRRHGGLGLGLSIAKVMIELHGGQIWVESTEGQGSNFSFIIPSREPSVFKPE